MSTSIFSEQMERIHYITNTRAPADLAAILGVRRSALAAAERRGRIPASWLLALLRLKRVNPDWVLTGEGARLLRPDDPQAPAPHVVYRLEVRPPAECSAQALIDELVRRALQARNAEEIANAAARTWQPVEGMEK